MTERERDYTACPYSLSTQMYRCRRMSRQAGSWMNMHSGPPRAPRFKDFCSTVGSDVPAHRKLQVWRSHGQVGKLLSLPQPKNCVKKKHYDLEKALQINQRRFTITQSLFHYSFSQCSLKVSDTGLGARRIKTIETWINEGGGDMNWSLQSESECKGLSPGWRNRRQAAREHTTRNIFRTFFPSISIHSSTIAHPIFTVVWALC